MFKWFLFCRFILPEERYSLLTVFVDMFVSFQFYISVQMFKSTLVQYFFAMSILEEIPKTSAFLL